MSQSDTIPYAHNLLSSNLFTKVSISTPIILKGSQGANGDWEQSSRGIKGTTISCWYNFLVTQRWMDSISAQKWAKSHSPLFPRTSKPKLTNKSILYCNVRKKCASCSQISTVGWFLGKIGRYRNALFQWQAHASNGPVHVTHVADHEGRLSCQINTPALLIDPMNLS